MSVRLKMRDSLAETAANIARQRLGITSTSPPPVLGFVLGTGLGDCIKLEDERSTPIAYIPGFEGLANHATHARRLCYGTFCGIPVIVVRGRIHSNEFSPDPSKTVDPYHWIRLLIDTVIFLGCKKLVLTCACGSLDDQNIKPNNVLVIDGFLTANIGRWPAWGTEHRQPSTALSPTFNKIGVDSIRARKPDQSVYTAIYAFFFGPIVEERLDKENFSLDGADVIGMSVTMEAAVVALHDDVDALFLATISNNSTDPHDNTAIVAMVRGITRKTLGENISTHKA